MSHPKVTTQAASGRPRSAIRASIGWTLAGLGFAPVMLALAGSAETGHYLSVFVLEKMLSLDNVAMFAAILGAATLTPDEGRKALTGGLVGALVLRVGFIAAGLAIVDAVHSVMLGFAAILVYSGVMMSRAPAHAATSTGTPAAATIARRLPRPLRARPGVAATLAIVVVDVAFAADSILAAFAITTSALPIIAANVFAVAGLRPLYVVLSDAVERFRYLRLGIGALLVGIGIELALERVIDVPSWVTPAAVATCLAASIGASVLADRRQR